MHWEGGGEAAVWTYTGLCPEPLPRRSLGCSASDAPVAFWSGQATTGHRRLPTQYGYGFRPLRGRSRRGGGRSHLDPTGAECRERVKKRGSFSFGFFFESYFRVRLRRILVPSHGPYAVWSTRGSCFFFGRGLCLTPVHKLHDAVHSKRTWVKVLFLGNNQARANPAGGGEG